ncbi:hypothetical protein [Paenibacillus xylanexedens]|uniref:hypothetical protein n=1 Tax=Paenibacillus xylanexedens TaxID=528191 RepID=UPI00119CA4FD|nr:hypothetical protein [Paenibacillus xylanexedens]
MIEVMGDVRLRRKMMDIWDEVVEWIEEDGSCVRLKKVDMWGNEKEGYGMKLGYMIGKVKNVLEEKKLGEGEGYDRGEDLIDDVMMIDGSVGYDFGD